MAHGIHCGPWQGESKYRQRHEPTMTPFWSHNNCLNILLFEESDADDVVL